MKVVFVSNLFPDEAENYRGLDNATLLHELRKSCDVRIISPRPTLPWKSHFRKPRAMDRSFSPIYLEYPYVPKLGSLFNHHFFTRAIREPLRNLRNEFCFDVILVSWTFPDACAVARVAEEMNVPFVTIVQGSDAHAYLHMPLRRKVIVESLNCASSVITRSAKLAELLANAGVRKDRLHPVYNGVDLETFRPAEKYKARQELGLAQVPTILFVGNFLPVKNPLLLIQAHAQIDPPVQLVMIGGGPLESEMRSAVATLGSSNRVIFAGRKTAVEVARYMQAADLLCLSSENEGVPNVVLEALATGIPVVSTDVGGIGEILNQEFLGSLVPKGNREELTKALQTWLASEVDAKRIRNYAEQFSWKRSAEAYLKLLKSAAEAESAR